MQCYVEVLIRDGIVLSITCPDAECKSSGILSVDEVRSSVFRQLVEIVEKVILLAKLKKKIKYNFEKVYFFQLLIIQTVIENELFVTVWIIHQKLKRRTKTLKLSLGKIAMELLLT